MGSILMAGLLPVPQLLYPLILSAGLKFVKIRRDSFYFLLKSFPRGLVGVGELLHQSISAVAEPTWKFIQIMQFIYKIPILGNLRILNYASPPPQSLVVFILWVASKFLWNTPISMSEINRLLAYSLP